VVVLAAGQARRMGRAKQLIEVDGAPLVCRSLDIAVASGAQQVVLVTGAYAPEVSAAVAPLAERQPHLGIVHNAAWATGQASSMQTGLAALAPAVEAAIFLPVDQPFVPPVLLRRLAHGWRRGADLVAPTVDGALRGAPALFDRRMWPELMAVEGDTGGRALLRRYAAHVQRVPAAASWLRDLDTPEDLG
jgi:molybdenum cofactor cytidylyltransferase